MLDSNLTQAYGRFMNVDGLQIPPPVIGGHHDDCVKRKLAIFSIVAAIVVVAFIMSFPAGTKTTVFFAPPRAVTNWTTPPMLTMVFDVTNTSARPVILNVIAVERQSDSGWLSDTQELRAGWHRPLGLVRSNSTAQLSFDLWYKPVPTRLQIVVESDATVSQKAGLAIRRLWENVRGREQYTQFWFSDYVGPRYQIVTPELP